MLVRSFPSCFLLLCFFGICSYACSQGHVFGGYPYWGANYDRCPCGEPYSMPTNYYSGAGPFNCTWSVDEDKDYRGKTKIRHMDMGEISLWTFDLTGYKESKDAIWYHSEFHRPKDPKVVYSALTKTQLTLLQASLQLKEWQRQLDEMQSKCTALQARISLGNNEMKLRQLKLLDFNAKCDELEASAPVAASTTAAAPADAPIATAGIQPATTAADSAGIQPATTAAASYSC